MTITELALLRLSSPTTLASVLPLFTRIKRVSEAYTGRPDSFHFFHQVEDPSCIYLYGEWDSLTQHLDGFIPGAANQTLLRDAEGVLAVELFLHVDVPQAALPLDAPVIGIERHLVRPERRQGFSEVMEEKKGSLEVFVTEGRPVGGWRVDPEKGESGEVVREEFVLFCGWRDVKQHDAFVETEAGREYGVIREYVEGLEVKHAVRVEGV